MNASTVSRSFALEAQLVDALQHGSAAALKLADRWFHLCPEVTVKWRIADLLLIHASSAPSCKPVRVSYFEAAIVAFLLERGPSLVDIVAHELFAPESAIGPRAERLARLGLIEVCGQELKATCEHWPGDLRIIAIEAKLARWRDAVQQAKSYRPFANQSYIAMPAEVYERNEAITAACQVANVGALAVHGDGTISTMLEATDIVPRSAEWVRVVASYVGVAQRSKVFSHVD